MAIQRVRRRGAEEGVRPLLPQSWEGTINVVSLVRSVQILPAFGARPKIAVICGGQQWRDSCRMTGMETTELDRISYLIIQAGIEIHRTLGPGLLESVYRTCMIHELRSRNLTVKTEVIIPVRYKDLVLDGVYRLDLLVEDAVIVELKAAATVLPVHRAQVLSYLRLTNRQLGLVMNFHVERLVLGIDRIVNKFGWPDTLAYSATERPTDTVKGDKI